MNDWDTGYENWYRDAKEEFENSEFYEEKYEHDFEVLDNGSVYLGAHHFIKNVVTPREGSEHYLPVHSLNTEGDTV